jgi:hypothetical protein
MTERLQVGKVGSGEGDGKRTSMIQAADSRNVSPVDSGNGPGKAKSEPGASL